MSDLISVIVPVYNAESYINECIKSICSQTYANFEVIIVNDGSTDNTLSMIQNLCRTEDKVRIINQENHGVSNARNRGIEASRGKFLCFVDADDLLEIDFIETYMNAIQQADVIFGNYKLLYENGRIVKKNNRLEPGLYKSESLLPKVIDDGTLTGILFGSVCGSLYRSSLIKQCNIRFDESIKINEDGIFNIEVLKSTSEILFIDDAKYLYRQWKTRKTNTISFDVSELDKSTKQLKKLCVGFPCYDLQFERREISILFWASLRVQNSTKSIFFMAKKLRRFCSLYRVNNLVKSLDSSRISKPKKFLIALLKYRFFFTYVFFVKRIVPILNRVINH